jgi:hypothetical protein
MTNLRLGKVLVAFTLILSAPSFSASFGSQQLAYNVRVSSVFKGAYGAIYVTFNPSSLTGCNGNYGGYLTSTWSEASAGNPSDPDAPRMQLAMLLAAKAMDSPLEVRFRVNATGTGWDKCTIDAIWVQ